MATLLHIDSSLNGDNSFSRKVTATFAEEWKLANPGGEYVYRDVNATPIPHLNADVYYGFGAEDPTPEQLAANAVTRPIVDEVKAADVILLGVPMYNFTIPSTLKSWLDRLAVPGAFPKDEEGLTELTPKHLIIATSRGGSYMPGTPRESFEHQDSYLTSFFSFLGLTENLHVLHTEMALSTVVPALAEFRHILDTTHAEAHEKARELAARQIPVAA